MDLQAENSQWIYQWSQTWDILRRRWEKMIKELVLKLTDLQFYISINQTVNRKKKKKKICQNIYNDWTQKENIQV